MQMNNLDSLPKKKILSLFMTCGFPTLNQSKKIFNEILSHQPDIIEFGLPFSDPMADGPIIQEANKLALRSKLSTQQSLDLIKYLSKSKNNTSFVIMCYLNTVRKFGLNKFIKNIKSIVDGIIIVDLPYEEEGLIKSYPEWASHLKKAYAGWRTYFLTNDLTMPKHMRLKPTKKTPLFNGALDCRLFEINIVAGSNRS